MSTCLDSIIKDPILDRILGIIKTIFYVEIKAML